MADLPRDQPSSYHREKVPSELPGDMVIRFRRRKLGLSRALGVSGLFGTAYGNVGSSIYYALGVVAMSALGLTPVVLIAASILFLFTGLTYAEGAVSLPESGGSGAFALRAFGNLVSFISSWVMMLEYVVTISISAFAAANYLGYFFPVLKTWPANSAAGIALVLALMVLNIGGIKGSSRLNTALVTLDIITMVTVAVLGVALVASLPRLIENIHWGVAPTPGQLLFGISISMVAYTGIETIANLGGETRNPPKAMPRAVFLVFVTVLALYSLLSITAMSAYPVFQTAGGEWVTDLTRKYLDDPILGITYAMPPVIQPFLSFWVAILAVTILTIATNAGIIGASRMAYFMGLRQQLPASVSRISKSHVPAVAIIIFSILACLIISIGQVTILVDLYAFGAMLAYTLAHASIIGLRIKEPDLPRRFKMPLNITIKGKEIPVLALVGGAGTMITWFIVILTHEYGRLVGFAWMAVGLVMYVIYRKATKQPVV